MVQSFTKKNISSPRADAEFLICYLLGLDRVQLISQPGRRVSKTEADRLIRAVQRRLKYEPIAYITGQKVFYDLTFKVSKRVFIPRPETELIIEEIKKYNLCGKKVLDIGTGCGNIGITLKHLEPNCFISCIDISMNAIKIARENSRLLLKTDHIEFIQSDLYENLSQSYDIIVSNPPYIIREEIALLQNDIKEYEPHLALDGGKDGMFYYRKIISGLNKYLNPGGYLFLEINPELKKEIIWTIKKTDLSVMGITKDYNGLDRIITARRYA